MRPLVAIIFIAGGLLVVPTTGCSPSEQASADGPAGGPVKGTLDTHCGGKKQPTSEAACRPAVPDGGITDGSADANADALLDGSGDDGGDDAPAGGGEYGATLFNAEGDDDECKYHVSFTVDPIRQGRDITFSLTVTTTIDGKPVRGATPRAEVFLDETHPAPNTDQKPVEVSDGKYRVGPIRFDKAGRWTVRFHYFEDCTDGEQSPHGHVAFFVDVP